MDNSLIDYLKQIPDSRSKEGNRHPLWLVLLIIIMGMMSGYWGYRQLGRFVERHRRLAEGIRGHWLIENRLHWVKDVIYEEDRSPQKTGFAPINLSLLKTWVLTLLRMHGFDSIKAARA